MEIATSQGPARVDLIGPVGPVGPTGPADAHGRGSKDASPGRPESEPRGSGLPDAGDAGGEARPDAPAAAAPPFLLVLTHGAGGTADSADLLAARDAALGLGGAVALVTQPYRVRGARAPGSAERQDEAWREIIAWLRANVDGAATLIQGGRSNGARVACRTAAAVGARGVLALAFPLRPPGRRQAASTRNDVSKGPADAAASPAAAVTSPRGKGSNRRHAAASPGGSVTSSSGGPLVLEEPMTPAEQTRLGELRQALGAGASVLVVNGDRDPFGIPDAGDATRVVVLKRETHSLSRNPAAVSGAVADWLSDVVRLAL